MATVAVKLTASYLGRNRRNKRLDVEGRTLSEPPIPSLLADLGAVDEPALSALVERTSRSAFEHVRQSLHRLDMACELIASGCPELQLAAPCLVFSLNIRHGPFDDCH